MPDANKLTILSRLREERDLTLEQMARYCGLHSRKGRESVSKWELGSSRPRSSRRSGFLNYLRRGLQLDCEQALTVWKVAETEWGWEPLTEAERLSLADAPPPAAVPVPSPPDISPTDRRNRETMLNRVRVYWIDGILEHSLYRGVFLALGLHRYPEAVDYPWEMVLQRPQKADTLIAPGTPIIDLYDEADRSLLILGDPGSGKTTLLLTLARDALLRAEQGVTRPMPVVFNLSSWEGRGQSIADWLLVELNSKYFIPKPIAQQWLNNNELLILLDGLDEVAAADRPDCVEAINRFRQTHLMPVVVSSRTQDYQLLEERLSLGSAVCIQPLDNRQIEAYFSTLGEVGLRVMALWTHDEALQELAHSPLMLNVMILAYQNGDDNTLEGEASLEERRDRLFEAYVQRMLTRRGESKAYTPRQTGQWLAWLANAMKSQAQSVFLIERLQPSWLSGGNRQRVYILFSRLLMGLLMGVVFGLSMLASLRTAKTLVGLMIAAGVTAGVMVSLGGTGILRSFWEERRQQRTIYGSHIWRWLGRVLQPAFVMGCVALFINIGFVWTNQPAKGLRHGLVSGVIAGLFLGFREYNRTLLNDIHPTEVSAVNWRRLIRGAIWGLIGGLSTGLLIAINSNNTGYFALRQTLTFGVMGSFVTAIFTGVSYKKVSLNILPSRGMTQSAKTALRASLGFGAVGVLLGMLMGSYNGALTFGILLGGLAGLWAGGLDVAQHLVLRLLLATGGATPWRYAQFLDHAVEQILLNKVGGGYTFIHRTLLEYFAERLPKSLDRPQNLNLRLGLGFAGFIILLGLVAYTLHIPQHIKADYYALQGYHYGRLGQADSAFEAYAVAVELDPNNPWNHNNLCWAGTLTGRAEAVRVHCEIALERLSTEWWVYDSRGLNRLLRGDTAGAMADFSVVVAQLEQTRQYPADLRERERWLVELRAGRNPITPVVLEHLRQNNLPLDYTK